MVPVFFKLPNSGYRGKHKSDVGKEPVSTKTQYNVPTAPIWIVNLHHEVSDCCAYLVSIRIDSAPWVREQEAIVMFCIPLTRGAAGLLQHASTGLLGAFCGAVAGMIY